MARVSLGASSGESSLTKASLACGLRALTALLSAAAVLGLVGAAGAADMANLTDVRIGVHGDHTRIVLETDGKAPYIVDAGEREVVVHIDAAASAEAVTAKSPHLIWAKVEPTPIGADVHISLKQPADVKAMVLTGPHRIVLDLYPKQGAPEPLPAPELLTEDEPAVTAGAEQPTPEPAVEEPGLPEAETEPSAEELVAAEVELTGEAEPGAPIGEEPEASADVVGPEPSAEADELAAGETPSAAADAIAEPATSAAPERPLRPAPEDAPGNRFGSPYLLAAAVAALLALFVFLRRRLRSAEKVVFPERHDDARAPYEPPQRAVPVDAPSAAGESLFDVEADALGSMPKDDELPLGLRRASPKSEDETERRIAHLERRIEELVDARERLERQVAAQTEELRVQRAAIARTQRVLRTVAPRTDDEPSSEPVRG